MRSSLTPRLTRTCLLWHVRLPLILLHLSHAMAVSFTYTDFNTTAGLTFNGAATTSSCEEAAHSMETGRDGSHPGYGYRETHGRSGHAAGESDERLFRREESALAVKETFTETSKEAEASEVSSTRASFAHQDEAHFGGYRNAPEGACPVRVRLTQSKPFEAGSVWRVQAGEVLNGFETAFDFQVTDLSKTCARVKDTAFSTKLYESCVVHGADGLAFVIHADPNGTAAIGAAGGGIGYHGIARSLAVELDSWYNADKGDLLQDHIAVHASGEEGNDAGAEMRLHEPVRSRISDGKVHNVRIRYWPFIKYDLFEHFAASLYASRFMMDNGEGYRVGTLAIWMDSSESPVVVVPINLSIVLGRHQKVWLGFTSSTGNAWAKHDILSWRFTQG